MFSQFLIFSTLTSLVFAAALPSTHKRAQDPWIISPYSTGCSPGGCSYGFNITGTQCSPDGPSFTTHCSGIEHVLGTTGDSIFTPCDDSSLLTDQVYNGTSRMIILEVKHVFAKDNVTWTVLGNATYSVDETKPTALSVTPSAVYAVA